MKVKLVVYAVLLFCAIFPVIPRTVTNREEKHAKFEGLLKEKHFQEGEHQADFDHDVVWGDEDEDDEVSMLPPEEQQERLRKLVENKIDADKDGYVTLDELTIWTLKSFDLFETEEARSQFPDIDTNRDGAIQWAEHVTDTFGPDFKEDSPDFINPPSDEWKDFVNSYNKDKKKFQASDLDSSEDLSLEEYLIFKHPRKHENTKKLLIEETLETSDLNKNGGIDLDEFLGDFTKNSDGSDPEWAAVEKEKFEDELDADHDGVLRGEEIVQWMSPDNHEMAKEEAEHLMQESDHDNDDKLSVEEIVDNYVDWVESDATDYGRQLLQDHDEL